MSVPALLSVMLLSASAPSQEPPRALPLALAQLAEMTAAGAQQGPSVNLQIEVRASFAANAQLTAVPISNLVVNVDASSVSQAMTDLSMSIALQVR